ncbi:hypothetical protein GGS21DRAFT_490647 [Xylaria nigripes]|nr:hypothetical protein GGS21DRAFT_490647 [Xylaria nigripes]
MPEVPQKMQQGLQRMELEATKVRYNSSNKYASPNGVTSGPHSHYYREPFLSSVLHSQTAGHCQQFLRSKPKPEDYSPASNFSPLGDRHTYTQFQTRIGNMNDYSPSFSPFPHVSGEHIPPSDDEKETVLASSKEHVLHSNDPDMQICWARDVLSYVEIAAEAAMRELEVTRSGSDRDLPPRPVTPQIEHELRVDAINIVTYLADQGHPEALFIRSKWLEFGKFGRRQDKKEAFNGYKRAAQQGWGRADYRIGMLYENSNDMEKAMRHYQAGLANKDSAAAYRLGMINLLGQRGTPKNVAKGLELIRQAADTADEDAPQGAFVYGMLVGRDLPDVVIPEGLLSYDVTVARQYIEKAAYLGFAKAQLKMGQAYELCQLGCEFMPSHSLHYYGLAARQGQPEASLGVSRWFLFGYEDEFAKNEQLAFMYAQMAAKTKLPTGEFAMGYYYEIGIAVEKDIREARRWYELAAEHGNQDAAARLEGLSQSKTLSKADHETATLTRIKSQHGSQRGKRPDRFKQNNIMPTLSEGQASPGASPQPSPLMQAFDHGEYRQPAFGFNVSDRVMAPYPEDHKPAPLNLSRPGSATPYHEDEMMASQSQLSPRYNQGSRPSSGPSADRPGSAFGIRTQSPGLPPAGQLAIPPAGTNPGRGRSGSTSGWQPGGYASPGHRPQDFYPSGPHYDGHAGPGPNRVAKMPALPAEGQRNASAPIGTMGPRGSPGSSGGPQSRPGSGGRPGPGVPLKDRPAAMDPAGRSNTRPSTPTSTTPAPPKHAKTGPATFEQMGIPQVKQESDCVVM